MHPNQHNSECNLKSEMWIPADIQWIHIEPKRFDAGAIHWMFLDTRQSKYRGKDSHLSRGRLAAGAIPTYTAATRRCSTVSGGNRPQCTVFSGCLRRSRVQTSRAGGSTWTDNGTDARIRRRLCLVAHAVAWTIGLLAFLDGLVAVHQVWVFGFGSINCFVNYYLDLVLSVSYNCSPYTEAPPCDSKKDTRRSTLPHDADIPSRRWVFMGRRMPVDTASSRNDVNRPGCRVAENIPTIFFYYLLFISWWWISVIVDFYITPIFPIRLFCILSLYSLYFPNDTRHRLEFTPYARRIDVVGALLKGGGM